jgi:hypothetical protein
MKLTGEYFSNKLNELDPLFQNLAIGLNESPDIMEVLERIARDAAEAQREKCYNAKFACQQEGCADCPNALPIQAGE